MHHSAERTETRNREASESPSGDYTTTESSRSGVQMENRKRKIAQATPATFGVLAATERFTVLNNEAVSETKNAVRETVCHRGKHFEMVVTCWRI